MMAQTTQAGERMKGADPFVDLPISSVAVALPLLLLPGTLCDARVFGPLAATFAGHSITDISMSGAASATLLARRILAVAPPRFALVGFSLGGIVALEIAAIAPERVAGLALIATTARPDPVSNTALRRKGVADARTRGVTAHFVDDIWPGSTAPANQNDGVLKAQAVAMAGAIGIEAFAQQAEIAISRADSRPRLSHLKMPTLVLCGAADSVCPPARHVEIADAIPGAELAIIPDAGHFVLLEAPDVVIRHLARWLKILSANTDTLPHRTARQTKDFQ
jgi:pimeloyl-ACP methyl ester carboxylesterase